MVSEQAHDALMDRMQKARNSGGDMCEHVPILYRLASFLDHVTEFGTGTGWGSTTAFLAAAPKHFHSYDLGVPGLIAELKPLAEAAGIDFVHHAENTLTAEIEPTDLLLVDTYHVYDQVKEELERHASKVRRYIAFHDTETFAFKGEHGKPGVWPAVAGFLRKHPEWRLLHHYTNCNGLTILERISQSVESVTMTTASDVPPVPQKIADRIFIGVPLLNRIDLLEKAIVSYDYPHELFVINNNSVDADFNTAFDALQAKLGFDSRRPRYNLGVAASWNLILMQAISRGYEFCYIGSNDTIMEPGELKKFAESPRNPEEGMWCGCIYNFYCLRTAVVTKVGWFDENFYPGYFEDNDWDYRCRLAGVKQIWRHGSPFKMRHLGSQTAASDVAYGQGLGRTFGANGHYFTIKWGGGPGGEKFKTPYNLPDKPWTWWRDPGRISLENRDWDGPKRIRMERVQELDSTPADAVEKAKKIALIDYDEACKTPSDVSEHLPVLYELGKTVQHITELGARIGITTAAFLAAVPKTLHTYDNQKKTEDINRMSKVAASMGTALVYHDTTDIREPIEETDLLFIDTMHTYDHICSELLLHGAKVRRYLIFHDTETFGVHGEQGKPGIKAAIDAFLKQNSQWKLKQHYTNCHGLTVLEKEISK